MTKLCFTLIQNNLYILSFSPKCIDDYHVFKSHSKERKNWEWYWRHIDKCQVAEFMNVIILPLIMNFCRSHFFFQSFAKYFRTYCSVSVQCAYMDAFTAECLMTNKTAWGFYTTSTQMTQRQSKIRHGSPREALHRLFFFSHLHERDRLIILWN